ncbi:MAG: HTTM domain-containing protein [Flavobacteriales bacterium]
MKEVTRLFRFALYAWLFFYSTAVLFLGEDAFVSAPVQLARGGGLLSGIGELVGAATPEVCMAIVMALMLLSIGMVRWPRWWLGLLTWLLFRSVTHRMWLASNGGIQLIENMLFWSSFMSFPSRQAYGHMTTWPHELMSSSAFWIGRLQLLLPYAVAAAHKFTGTTWLDGTAMSLVAADPTFHLGWLVTSPVVCMVLTYATLGFMTLFPLAVWWKPTRRLWLCIGVVFHLSTAIFMDIPQMAFAFIACYSIWLNEDEAQVVMQRLQLLLRPNAVRGMRTA